MSDSRRLSADIVGFLQESNVHRIGDLHHIIGYGVRDIRGHLCCIGIIMTQSKHHSSVLPPMCRPPSRSGCSQYAHHLPQSDNHFHDAMLPHATNIVLDKRNPESLRTAKLSNRSTIREFKSS